MQLAGVAASFGVIMYLVSKKVSVGLSLLIGGGIIGLFSDLGWQEFLTAAAGGILSPMTIELAIAVALISGLGKLMRESGDLEMMVESLVAQFRNPKVLIMILPSLIGTISIPGGAIMSAPMVEENGNLLGLDATTKAAVNLFSRHFGYFVYPLHASIIVLSEIFVIRKSVLISYNVLAMLVGLFVAYRLFFRGVDYTAPARTEAKSMVVNLRDFLLSFSPVLVALSLILILDVPFYLAMAIGVLIAMVRGLPPEKRLPAVRGRVGRFFFEWIDYRLVFTIIGLMTFRALIEASGVVSTLAGSLFAYGIPLPVLVVMLGLVAAYLTGSDMAAAGILAAFFAPFVPENLVVLYASLLFTSALVGYLVSPIHLCLVLTNQHFGAKYSAVARKIALPLLAMLATAVIQTLILIL
ncbi:MAG: DUF401 family protein [Firmicutes bacterium]|nr:DUF401 family protein [Bacillota bacterium]